MLICACMYSASADALVHAYDDLAHEAADISDAKALAVHVVQLVHM